MASAVATWTTISTTGVVTIEAGLFDVGGFMTAFEGYNSNGFVFRRRFATAHLGALFFENGLAR